MLYNGSGLTKVFRGRKVLDIAELAVEEKKIYALTGANGAGKSTLLNLLAFLDQPDGGSLRFCGEKVVYGRESLLTLRRRVVLLDQYPILFTAPVWKNVEFGLKVRGMEKRLRARRVAEVLERVGMEDFFHADAHKLSGGEGKRVALARALAVAPEVLLCDEPTANVDEENQEIILDILKTINTEEQTSIIMATHYLSQGRQLADHSLILAHGRLSLRGSENSFRCRMRRQDDGSCFCEVNERFGLRLERRREEDCSRFCRLSIDPTGVRCFPSADSTTANLLTGRVLCVEQDRDQILLTVDCGLKLKVVLAVSVYRQYRPLVGEVVKLLVPEESIFLSPS